MTMTNDYHDLHYNLAAFIAMFDLVKEDIKHPDPEVESILWDYYEQLTQAMEDCNITPAIF